MTSLYLSTAGALFLLAMGSLWAFWPERVVASPRSGASDPRTVRAFGLFVIALGALILLANLISFVSE